VCKKIANSYLREITGRKEAPGMSAAKFSLLGLAV
jgi:hypothetical protein